MHLIFMITIKPLMKMSPPFVYFPLSRMRRWYLCLLVNHAWWLELDLAAFGAWQLYACLSFIYCGALVVNDLE